MLSNQTDDGRVVTSAAICDKCCGILLLMRIEVWVLLPACILVVSLLFAKNHTLNEVDEEVGVVVNAVASDFALAWLVRIVIRCSSCITRDFTLTIRTS